MAFEFLGTFNKSQFDRFLAFAKSQLADIDGRILHLNFEKQRIGNISFVYEGGGIPSSYTVSSATTTYIGGLVSAYEVLGGSVLHDLQVRSRSQAVYLLPGDEVTPPQYMSNGEMMAGKGLEDATTAEYVREARDWMLPSMQHRREYLERKIRKALDYAEQLADEIDYLELVRKPANNEYSLENLSQKVAQLYSDPQYKAITDDKGTDTYGKLTYAPFLPYSRTGATQQTVEPGEAGRDIGGFVEAGVSLPADGEGTA